MRKSKWWCDRKPRTELLMTECRYHVERFLREVIIPRLAPVSREMCLNYLAEKVLGLPRSY